MPPMKNMSSLSKKHSLQTFVVTVALLIMLPIAVLLVILNIISLDNFHKERTAAHTEVLSTLSNEISENLDSFEKFLLNYLAVTPDFSVLVSTQDTSAFNMSKYRLYQTSSHFVTSLVSGMFFSTDNEEELVFFSFSDIPLEDQQILSENLAKQFQSTENSVSHWSYATLSGKRYLIETLASQGAYFGAVMDFEDFFDFLPESSLDQAAYLMCIDGVPVSGRGEISEMIRESSSPEETLQEYRQSTRYLVLEKELQASGGLSVAIVAANHALVFPYGVPLVIILLSVWIGLMLVTLVFLLEKYVVHPIQIFSHSMEKTDMLGAPLEVPSRGMNREIAALYGSFNCMLAKNQQLVQNLTSERKERAEAEYNYLRSQINPHFFMNLLNTLYTFALARQTEALQQTLEFMSSYYRYVLRKKDSFVPLEEEIQHAEDYLNIQNIRYPGLLFWSVELEEEAKTCPIPILSIQTLIENVMEHAFDRSKALSISIQAVAQEDGTISILVADNGPGFPLKVLEEMEKSQVAGDGVSHIGLLNIKRRLQLLYKEQGQLHLWNGPQGGAYACIILPFVPPTQR